MVADPGAMDTVGWVAISTITSAPPLDSTPALSTVLRYVVVLVIGVLGVNVAPVAFCTSTKLPFPVLMYHLNVYPDPVPPLGPVAWVIGPGVPPEHTLLDAI